MKSKLTGYKAFGRVVYSTHANGGQVAIEKCADENEAKQKAASLRRTLFSSQPSQPMTESEMYQAQGRMGLTSEEDDF